MINRLQRFDHHNSSYERPNSNWICGRTADGCPCGQGPDRSGRCQIKFECAPVLAGESWVCTRPENAGGPCETGPDAEGRCCRAAEPCRPVRSLRSRRGIVGLWFAALTIGGLLMGFGLDGGRGFVHPGPEILGHAEIADCKTCHVAFEEDESSWLLAAFRKPDPVADSKKCQACHDKGENALLAHSMDGRKLKAHTEAIKKDLSNPARPPMLLQMSERLFDRPNEVSGSLACASCHKEHQGETFDPTLVSNDRCQSCHSVKFPSLAAGHPPFGGYPYKRRTRIAFDHEKHFRKNFEQSKKPNAPKTCATCHQPGPAGEYMLVQSFESTCATCHMEDIEGKSVSGPKGILVLNVPGLDRETLEARGYSVGQWPDLALSEGFTPFMKLLLSRDVRIADDLDAIDLLDLQDLAEATEQDLATVQRVAWAMKELLMDLVDLGPEAVEARLTGRLTQDVDNTVLARMLGQISLDVLRAASRSWFPALRRDVEKHREEKAAYRDSAWQTRFALWRQYNRTRVRAVPGDESGVPGGKRGSNPGLIQLAQAATDLLSDSDDLLDKESLRLDDLEQLLKEDAEGDNSLFKTPAHTAAPAPEPAEEKNAAEPAEEQKVAEPEPSPEPEPEAAPEGEGKAVASEEEPAKPEAETETAGQVPTVVPPAKPEPPQPASPEPELLQEPAPPAMAEKKSVEPEETPAEVAAEVPQDAPEDLEEQGPDPEVWASAGGWFRRDDSLYYRPAEHYDRFMQTWLDLAAGVHGTAAESYGAAILARFGDKDTPGKCTKCHSIDRQEDGVLHVNWQPFAPAPNRKSFTHFNHSVHFSQVEEKGCMTCHELSGATTFAAGFSDFDPQSFTSNFSPIKREVCADCHTEVSAGDACVTCHRYHIGTFAPTPVNTTIASLAAPVAVKKEEDEPEVPRAVVAARPKGWTDSILEEPGVFGPEFPIVPEKRKPVEALPGPAPDLAALAELGEVPGALDVAETRSRWGWDEVEISDAPGEEFGGIAPGAALAHANQLGAPLRQDGIAPSAAESDNLQEPAAEEKPALILLKLEVSPSLGAAKMMRKQLRASHPEVLGARSIFFHKAEGVEGAPGYSVLAGPFLDQAMAESQCDRLQEQSQTCTVVQYKNPISIQ